MRLPNSLLAGLQALLFVSLSLAACSGNTQEVQPDSPATAPAAPMEQVAGIQWRTPEGWQREASRPMRAATYTIRAAEGDREDAECAVYYFGEGQGGSVEANIRRWIGQFEQPDGKPIGEDTETEKRAIGGLDVTTLELSGTYLASAGPMAPVREKKPEFRMLGAIVEAPLGPVFFKMVGPANTVTKAEDDFEAMLKALKRQ